MVGGTSLAAYCTLSYWLVLVSPFSAVVEGVDRSKFRTCAQTSFCRRHREVKPNRSKTFKLKKSSIQFVFNDKDEGKKIDAESGKDTKEKKGIWKSLFGSKDDGTKRNEYLGPSPVFSAILSTLDEMEELQLNIHLQEDGVARLRIKETDEFVSHLENLQKPEPRWTSDDLVLKNDTMTMVEHVTYVSSTETEKLTSFIQRIPDHTGIDASHFVALQYHDAYTILIRTDSFQVHMFDDSSGDRDAPIVSLNAQTLMHFEQRRSHKNGDPVHASRSQKNEDLEKEEVQRRDQEATDNEGKKIVGYWEDGKAIYEDGSRDDVPRLEVEEESPKDEQGIWDEKFGSHHDSKPYGPMSVGMDISFPQSQHLFGIPEHASKTLLQTTRGSDSHYKEPYRLYNLDVFEYELDETMALYGSIPFLISHRMSVSEHKSSTTGVFWMNPTETFIDVFDTNEDGDKATHWVSESGIVDIFLLPGGDNPAKVYKQYASLTGYPYLPPSFALGYHQCRWNYRDEADVSAVHANFEKYDYPYDVLWLDIEHTDGKRYFTWDKHNFPNPATMQEKLKAQGRNMVTIVDPHIKRDNSYYVHKEASSKNLYIKDKDGKDFDGWCWPGASSYPDFTSAHVREWWASQFAYSNYRGSTSSLYTWNDMNEPSVFNGPEVSMQKDTLNLEGVEHREWHNLYGMTFHRATAEGLVARKKEHQTRPFVLSRSFFAGSQQYGPIWTGDNTAEWSHLEIASKMLLSLNIAGLPFVGADVGGFFGNPDSELLVRWNQAAAYQPFFRGHAHHDSARREPWVFGQETLELMRNAAMARYALLPYWYTVFWIASVTGIPMMRPMWMEYPLEDRMFGLDDQYLIGSDLLVKPITGQGETETGVVFPVGSTWYDVDTLSQVSVDATGSTTVQAELDKIPVYQRGGSIIPRKLRLRRSASLMYNDPYTLYVALDNDGKASGVLYMDDENSFNYEDGEYGVASFDANLPVDGSTGSFSNKVTLGKSGFSHGKATVERIIIMGIPTPPSILTVGSKELTSQHDSSNQVLVVRKPELSALEDWTITVEF